MSATLFKKVDYTLAKLLHDIEFGDIGLPDIQRPFVWTHTRVRELFDSMYRGFPVGYLLFWATEAAGARQIGADQKQRRAPRLLIIDGQQRLTSLYAVLRGRPVVNADYKADRIQIAFRPSDGTFEVADAAIRRDSEYIPDISVMWATGKTSYAVVKEFLQKLKAARDVTDEEEERISHAIDGLFDLQNYPFTALEISASVEEEEVADIFVRINSQGVKLNQADFILTLMSVFWDEGRAELERFCHAARVPPPDGRPSPYNHFIQPGPDQLLRTSVALGFGRARLKQVYSILRGKDLETGIYSEERRVAQFERLKQAQTATLDLTSWHEFLKALIKAGYRTGAMISSENALLFSYAWFLIARNSFGVDLQASKSLMARWFFVVSLTGRYTGSFETVMEEDLARLRDLNSADECIAMLEGLMASAVPNDFWEVTLPSELESAAARSPALFAYYAALNVLNARVLLGEARVSELLDPALKQPRTPLERHHLFPRKYLKRIGVSRSRLINQAANFSLVEWVDNSGIGGKPPAEYVPQYEQNFTADEVREMYALHALPSRWYELSYEEFLLARRPLMARVIRRAYEALT